MRSIRLRRILRPRSTLVLDIGRVAPADGARHGLRILGEARQHFQQRLAVVEEDVPPHHRVGGGDAREVAEAGGREAQHFLPRLIGKIIGRAADGEGEQMRQVADDSQHTIMMRGLHNLDHRAEALPERRDLVDRLRIGAGGRHDEASSGHRRGSRSRHRGRRIRCPPADGRARNARRPAPAARHRARTEILVDPTSVSTLPGDRRGAMAAAISASAPTGTQSMTQSAPTTARSDRAPRRSAMPSSVTRAQTASLASQAMISAASPCFPRGAGDGTADQAEADQHQTLEDRDRTRARHRRCA